MQQQHIQAFSGPILPLHSLWPQLFQEIEANLLIASHSNAVVRGWEVLVCGFLVDV
jgi:hypothetical protein